MKKYLLLVVIVVACLILDLGTKHLAQTNLASELYDHAILLEVPQESRGATVFQTLSDEFAWSSDEEVQAIATRSTDILASDGSILRTGNLADYALEGGEQLRVRHRTVNVIDGFLDFRYVENKGAAWGFLSDRDASFRQPFFLIIGLLAIGVVMALYRSVPQDHKLLLTALALILGGALGNISDRIRFRYVVDFIHCRPGFDYPTFNVADALIVIGVGLMIIQLIRDRVAQRRTHSDATDEAGNRV